MRRTLDQAKIEVARRMVALAAVSAEVVLSDLLRQPTEEMVDAQRALDNLLAELAADPALRVHMRCWMVDFHGHAKPAWAESGELSPEDIVEALTTLPDDLGKRVGAWLDFHNFNVTDSGAGLTGWDLGVHCTDEEMRRLTELAHTHLRDELDAGVLTMELKFWGFKLIGVETPRQAQKLLEN